MTLQHSATNLRFHSLFPKGSDEKRTSGLEFILFGHFPCSVSKSLPMGILVKGNINMPVFELPSETEVKYTCDIAHADQ
jgi:hypothetical protein